MIRLMIQVVDWWEQEPFHRECFYVTGTWFTDDGITIDNKITFIWTDLDSTRMRLSLESLMTTIGVSLKRSSQHFIISYRWGFLKRFSLVNRVLSFLISYHTIYYHFLTFCWSFPNRWSLHFLFVNIFICWFLLSNSWTSFDKLLKNSCFLSSNAFPDLRNCVTSCGDSTAGSPSTTV